MGFKELQTRIALKYDEHANWGKWYLKTNPNTALTAAPDFTADGFNFDLYEDKGAALKLNKGEIGLCAVSAKADASTAPTVLFKVGDGVHRFCELKWSSALAADVYGWAKASDVVYNPDAKTITFVGGNVADNGTRTDKVFTFNYITETEVTAITNPIAADVATNADAIEAEAKTRAEADEALEKKYDEAIEGINEAIEGANAAAAAAAKAVTDLANGQVATNTGEISKNAAAITNEVDRATGVEAGLSGRLAVLEAFFKSADADGKDTEGGKTLYDALDTLKEIQDYILNDGNAASDMLDAIDANADAIAALQDIVNDGGTLESRVDIVESSLATAEDNIDDLADAVEILQAATAGYDATTTISSAISGVSARAEKGISDAADALAAAQDAQSDVDDLADVVGSATSGLVQQVNQNASKISNIEDDYVSFRSPSEGATNADGNPKINLFAGDDIIIFNCGSAADVI